MQEIEVKSVLNRKKQRDSWFLDDFTLNPYSGCSFNCVYCYIRGSKYGINMEEKTSVKKNAAELLAKQLKTHAKKNRYGFIVISSSTDPYLQLEEKTLLTRKCLEVILQHKFPVHIITKSSLVKRDFDLLKEINTNAVLPEDLRGKFGGTIITFSFSTAENETGKIFEPGATPPEERLLTMKVASEAGFLTGVSMMPLLPFISDTEEQLEKMFAAFKNHGAHYVMPAGLTLFGNETSDSRTLTLNAIRKYFPHLLTEYENLLGRKDYLPANYHEELYKKTSALLRKYELRGRIV